VDGRAPPRFRLVFRVSLEAVSGQDLVFFLDGKDRFGELSHRYSK